MRLAWFRPAHPNGADPLDDSGALVEALRASHQIDVITAALAHDFVWMHYRHPYDLCVFELDNTPAHQFIWPYLFHYGGVTMLRTLMLNESRASALAERLRGDDYRAEFEFSGDARLLRAPLLASRAVVVAHEVTAAALQEEYPEARVRYAPSAVQGVQGVQGVQKVQRVQRATSGVVTIGVLGATNQSDVIQRACQRACDAGAPVTLIDEQPPDVVLREADIVIAVRWPMSGEPETAALAAMAAGTPVVVMETEVTADWPAYDPQTWRPRGTAGGGPIAVSIDPRDEEHSLMVAIRDLARDPTLRQELGAAAQAWWRAHATVEQSAAEWERIIEEARTLEPPRRPAGWPAHLTADGTEKARAILRDTGGTVDFL
jgi:hypothetical protein